MLFLSGLGNLQHWIYIVTLGLVGWKESLVDAALLPCRQFMQSSSLFVMMPLLWFLSAVVWVQTFHDDREGLPGLPDR